jgi:hypothetical protein
MPAIDFPNSPTTNQEFTSGGRTWIWDGTVWNAKETAVSLLTATAPLIYDSETNNISLDPAGLIAVQDNYVLTLMSAI